MLASVAVFSCIFGADVELGDSIVGRLGESVGLCGYTLCSAMGVDGAKVLVDGAVPPSLRCCAHLYGDWYLGMLYLGSCVPKCSFGCINIVYFSDELPPGVLGPGLGVVGVPGALTCLIGRGGVWSAPPSAPLLPW